MQNLRIVTVNVIDSTHIEVTFTHDLTTQLSTANVTIVSETTNNPSSDVIQVNIAGSKLSITCLPLNPYYTYYIVFNSTSTLPFISLNGDAKLIEDGVVNKYLITGPLPTDNIFKQYLFNFLRENIYNIDDSNTIVNKYIQSLAINLSKALYDIRLVKNENYLSFDVIDERKVRGPGPYDRLDEEGAYQLIRAGLSPSATNASMSLTYTEFPYYPITLQKETTTEILYPDSVDESGKFNINNLILNLSKNNVTKINSITFNQNTINPVLVYDIITLGYQIYDSKYDQEYSSSYTLLETNQIKLNDQIFDNSLFEINQLIRVVVEYEYKNLGRVVDEGTVTVYTAKDATREIVPAIINVFTLDHAPIINVDNSIPELGGVEFLDYNNSLGTQHSAFITEIPFRAHALPSYPGQYAVDYNTGNVYVYGSDLNNTGTGEYPPLASYKYRLTYQSEIDYVYDSSTLDIVALPNGSLIDYDGTINFSYEQVLVSGIDYVSALHQEELSERIENRLLALNVIKPLHTPVTNVFRIYNETSGEIYNITRWSDDKIYFAYQTAPRINLQLTERATFATQANEMMFVNNISTNTNAIRVFTIYLDNNNIISASEDGLGYSCNSSVSFSNSIFVSEKWYNRNLTSIQNIDKLENVGEYIIDYVNGIIYCGVSATQDNNIGYVTYKINSISPVNPHLISVDDIYYQVSPLNSKDKQFDYLSFSDGAIIPLTLDYNDEMILNSSSSSPYIIYSGQIGAFVGTSFVSSVSNKVKYVRAIYALDDLNNSTFPMNFASVATSSGASISVDSIIKQIYSNVLYDGYDYYINLDENIPYLSSSITYTFSVIRLTDLQELWDTSGIVQEGSTIKLILSGVGTPVIGDPVRIDYSFTINDLSSVIVDYNKGDYFIDYTYLADEIILSYEYGDNVLDFRTSLTVPENTEYYVSYKAGALRDGLYKNFGNLINIPELTNFNIDFDRERYRDALNAALTSFLQGPTVSAIKNIGKTISHITPEINEEVFSGWSLGNSLLNPEEITTTGTFQLLPAKYDLGTLIDSTQTITFPITSNIKLEEGTFETWILPQWNGLDNEASLTFSILKNNVVIDPVNIFIGAGEYHPELTNNVFTLDKNSRVDGIPNKSKDGVFIYYDKDISGDFYRWYVEVIDGYISFPSATYKIIITSSGNIYDAKTLIIPKPSNLSMFTGVNKINLTVTGGSTSNCGITFISDYQHYLLDFGENTLKNRVSLFKDAGGYINFRVIDKEKYQYIISKDISSWTPQEKHHIAISWKLNTIDNRDEMHLFVDGFEVPNVFKYGQNFHPYLHENFRTISSEEIIGLSGRDIISGTDLSITKDGYTVSSSIVFGNYNIFAGDKIFIDEVGFDSSGYTITIVSGQILTLDYPMPITLSNARFSINRTDYIVDSSIDIASNIQVSTISSILSGADMSGVIGTNIVTTSEDLSDVQAGYSIHIDGYTLQTVYTILQVSSGSLIISDDLTETISNVNFNIYSNTETEIPGVRAVRPSYSISKDGYYNNILTLSNSVYSNDLVLIRTMGLNSRKVKKQYYVWSDNKENILMTRLPSPISLDEVSITKLILNDGYAVAIGPLNSTLIAGAFNSINFPCTHPSNSQTGRTIKVTISGNNTDFTSPVQVTINGVSGYITISETILFTDYGSMDFTNKFVSINYINVIATPINPLKAALVIDVREKYSITYAENSALVPIVKYSYLINNGTTLQNDGYYTVKDLNNYFSEKCINSYLLIQSPIVAAGYYKIIAVSSDKTTLTLEATNASPYPPYPIPTFTNGTYKILNTTDYRAGLQNGFFTLESSVLPGSEYYLLHGFYEIEYFTYASIKLDINKGYVYLGSDFTGNNQINAIIDQVKIYSKMLTDVRIGEQSLDKSITQDYNSLKALKKDSDTLALINFDEFPFVNNADFYINKYADKQHFHSSSKVNENFNDSLALIQEPMILSNDGILDTRKEGTIEFWTSSIYDTGNDPITRYYFDATSAVIEESVSVDCVSVKINNPIETVLSVTLKAGDQNIDYFAGGSLEIDTQRAIQETQISTSSVIVTVNSPILQVISVKISGDYSNTDYFNSGMIGTDLKTIYLGKELPSASTSVIVTYQSLDNNNVILNTQVIRLNKKLPSQKSHVIVKYIPKGAQGDRLSIYKDDGYINFSINASGTNYLVRTPTYWTKNTWHRVKASYKLNGGLGQDEMTLFVDGYKCGNTYSSVMGNIVFEDSINTLYVGSQYTGSNKLFGLINNLRISNIYRPIYTPYNEPIDAVYNRNLNVVFPVTTDLYTTYLLDSSFVNVNNTDFATIVNRNSGAFDFSVNIMDSFGIVNSSIKVQEVLEKLIKILKPANSKVYISYTR